MVVEHYWRQFEVIVIKVHSWLHIMTTHRAGLMHVVRAV